MGKATTVPSDVDVEMLCSFVIELRGYSQEPPNGFLDRMRGNVRAALANEAGYEEWDHVRAAWALLCRERRRMEIVLRQEAACQNGKDRDDAPYAAAVLAMVADELEVATMLYEAPETVALPTMVAAPEKPHDEAPPSIEAVVTVLVRQALRAGTMRPTETLLLLTWLSAPHNPNARI